MGQRLGLTHWGSGYFAGKHSAIPINDWYKIVKYYTETAPVKLASADSIETFKDWGIFNLKEPGKGNSATGAITTMISYDTAGKNLYTADAQNNLFKWSSSFKPKLVQELPSPATSAVFVAAEDKRQMLLTCIGTLAPVDADTGKLVSINLQTGKPKILQGNLPRPVQVTAADLDKDGIKDYVLCNFGHNRGGLYWLKALPNGGFENRTISNTPGATSAVTGDFNHDGLTDVICLFAQGDEGIWLFLNNGKGGFNKKILLRFPPVYGSSNFQLVDINHDGAPDIIYTAGDNADLSPIPKPYHGVYVFLNDGRMSFIRKYFYPMNGCTKAIAADFKGNGVLDIVAIAFFTPKEKPERGFVYLEQSAGLKFKAHQLPIANKGKWLTMDVNDYNNDGYPDVALGNFSFDNLTSVSTNSIQNELPLIILENQSRLNKNKPYMMVKTALLH
nr:VCBS repeat-containing protein [Mucilaginibacter sp. L294]